MAVAHVLFAIDTVVLYARSLQFFVMNEKIGPLLIMIRSMFYDLILFMLILLITLLGYGVALHSILNPYFTFNWSLINGVLHIPYFQIYGELGVEEILHSANGTVDEDTEPEYRNYLGLALAGSYLLFTNIMLINLLIAMFNSTYIKIEEDAAYYNVINMNEVLLEYKEKLPLPPPIVIFTYIPRICNKYWLQEK